MCLAEHDYVIDQLPKQFNASNVRRLRGLKNKRPTETGASRTALG
jgi:hypothetical protein